eukprot:bmy_02983T0
MNGWKAAWGEAGRGTRRNFTTLRSLQWRPVWGGGTGATGRTEEPAVGCSSTGRSVGRTQAWEDAGAVSVGLRSALPGLGLRLRLSPGPRPPARWRPRPISPPKPRANPGPALAHLPLPLQHPGLHPARAWQSRGPVRSADSRGAGLLGRGWAASECEGRRSLPT